MGNTGNCYKSIGHNLSDKNKSLLILHSLQLMSDNIVDWRLSDPQTHLLKKLTVTEVNMHIIVSPEVHFLLTYQPAVTLSIVHGSKAFLATPCRPQCLSSVGQYLNSLPSEPPGLHKIPQVSTANSEDSDMVSATTCFAEGGLYFRGMQLDSRCSLQESASSRCSAGDLVWKS